MSAAGAVRIFVSCDAAALSVGAEAVAAAADMTVIPVRVQANPAVNSGGGHEIIFILQSTTDPEVSISTKARFYLPTP